VPPAGQPDDPRRHVPRRHVALQGVYNARDLGGYLTVDHRRVRWGRVYRSAALGQATEDDVAELTARGVRLICDFRSGPERVSAPNTWAAVAGIESWGLPALESIGDSRQLLEVSMISEAETRALMTRTYRQIPFDQARSYAHVFARLVQDKTPLLFHCAAGKDRSGVAAALLLDVLGVSREAILEDYLLSNRVRSRIEAAFVADPRHERAIRDSSRSWAPLMDADARYLAAMFDAVESQRGSVAEYFLTDLGIDAGGLGALRAQLLE
jgi:protein-tyrosine phosphatase